MIMMMWGYGYGWPMLWLVFWNILWLVLLGLLIWALVRWFPKGGDFLRPSSREPSALEILRQRYARGEIDTATFEQMRERLEACGEREKPPA
jgi:putative membrane protein